MLFSSRAYIHLLCDLCSLETTEPFYEETCCEFIFTKQKGKQFVWSHQLSKKMKRREQLHLGGRPSKVRGIIQLSYSHQYEILVAISSLSQICSLQGREKQLINEIPLLVAKIDSLLASCTKERKKLEK